MRIIFLQKVYSRKVRLYNKNKYSAKERKSYSTTKFKNYSANLSPFDTTLFIVDTLLNLHNDELVAAFEENDGRKILHRGEEVTPYGTKEVVVHLDASDKQILADVEFKRAYSPNAFKKKMFVDLFVKHVYTQIQEGYDELNELLSHSEMSESAKRETLDKYVEGGEQISDTLCLLVDFAIKDIENCNFAGLKQFMTVTFADYSSDTLTEETLDAYCKEYLISDIDLETLTTLFGENKDDCLTAIDYIPGYSDTFDLTRENGKDVIVFSYGSSSPQSGSEITTIIGIFMLVVAFIQLIFFITTIVRMVRIIKEQPFKRPKISKNKLVYMTFLMTACLIVSPIAALVETQPPFVGGFAFASLASILVNILLIAAEIYLTKRAD